MKGIVVNTNSTIVCKAGRAGPGGAELSPIVERGLLTCLIDQILPPALAAVTRSAVSLKLLPSSSPSLFIMVSDEPRIRSYVLSGFIHTHDVNPVHGADFASQVVHAGLGGAWAGFIYGGAATWYRTPGLRTILGGALKGAGWFGGFR